MTDCRVKYSQMGIKWGRDTLSRGQSITSLSCKLLSFKQTKNKKG